MAGWEQLERLLAAALPGARLLTSQPLTGGVSAEVSLLTLEGSDGRQVAVVLRAHGARHGGLDAGKEFDLLKAVWLAGIPTAKPLYVDARGEFLGVPCLLLEYVEGTSNVPAVTLPAVIDTMAEQLLAVHGLATTGFPALPVRVDPLPELFDFLPSGQRFAALRPLLEGLSASGYEGEPCLLHGDYWPENLLWQGGQLRAILDWEDAAYGDPLCDLAGARVELRYRFGADAMLALTNAYAAQRPVDEQRLALWQIYVAAAGQHFMGRWGLPREQEVQLRRLALLCIEDAMAVLAN